MKHLKKFFEYYVVDPNFEGFETQVIKIAEEKFAENKDMTFEELKNCVIESFGGMHRFKYGDDFQKELKIIDKVCSAIIKGLDD